MNEGFLLSSRLMIIHMHDLKTPRLGRAKQMGDVRSRAPQVGSVQHYVTFVRLIFCEVPLGYKRDASSPEGGGGGVNSHCSQNRHSHTQV
jgi:hypothetical protein